MNGLVLAVVVSLLPQLAFADLCEDDWAGVQAAISPNEKKVNVGVAKPISFKELEALKEKLADVIQKADHAELSESEVVANAVRTDPTLRALFPRLPTSREQIVDALDLLAAKADVMRAHEKQPAPELEEFLKGRRYMEEDGTVHPLEPRKVEQMQRQIRQALSSDKVPASLKTFLQIQVLPLESAGPLQILALDRFVDRLQRTYHLPYVVR